MNETHITVILDRTGSMESIRDDVIGGFNAFLDEQKAAPGSATMTLVQFDACEPYEVLQDVVDIQDVDPLTRETYVPRSATPLLDAMGRGINGTESAVADVEETPPKVVVVVITDGQENASKEFTKDRITKMVGEKRDAGWQFVFLSSDMDSIQDAGQVGYAPAATMAYAHTGDGSRNALTSMSSAVRAFRCDAGADHVEFTDEDRVRSAGQA